MTTGSTMRWNDRLVHARGDDWQPRSEVSMAQPFGPRESSHFSLRWTRVRKQNTGGTEKELVVGKDVFVYRSVTAGSVGG
jgi:hypothetical protein